MKLAPTVETVWAGLNAPLQYRVTSDVFPTPWEPSTTILASSEDMVTVVKVGIGIQGRRIVKEYGCSYGIQRQVPRLVVGGSRALP
jgi:hypothetical protein